MALPKKVKLDSSGDLIILNFAGSLRSLNASSKGVLSPITTIELQSFIEAKLRALTIISGPTPPGSPIVIASLFISGYYSMAI